MDFTRLIITDQELHRLTRRRLQERPADPLASQENIDELRTDLERGVAIDALFRPMPMPAKSALGILLSHPANRVATIGAMHPGAISAMMRG
jgi:hypothetical protein